MKTSCLRMGLVALVAAVFLNSSFGEEARFDLPAMGGFAVSPDGSTLVVSLTSKTELACFDTQAGKELKRVKVEFQPTQLAWGDKVLFAAQKSSGRVHILDPETGKELATGNASGPVRNLALVKDVCFASTDSRQVFAIDARGKSTKTAASGSFIPADPHPNLDQLAAFDTGLLPPAEREAVERHLARCADCGRRVDGLPEDPFVALVRASASSAPTVSPVVPEGDVPAELLAHPRYRLLERVGSGGMGVVYKAVHQLMDRVVALKVPHRHFLGRPGFAERFRREARAAARLTHPNIVLAHDAEQAGDLPFLIMEYVPGTSLDRLMARRGPLPVAEACECVRQAALGLQHAHDKGMVHRDVKPANLMRTPVCKSCISWTCIQRQMDYVRFGWQGRNLLSMMKNARQDMRLLRVSHREEGESSRAAGSSSRGPFPFPLALNRSSDSGGCSRRR
jgi:hypothetical protein